jgi:hypothetical protein
MVNYICDFTVFGFTLRVWITAFNEKHRKLVMKNNRIDDRTPFEKDIEISLEDGKKLTGKMINISSGGTYIKMSPQPEFDTKLKIYVDLPHVPGICEIPCIVRWVKGESGVGLQFEHLRAIEVWALNKIKRGK